MQNRKTNTDQKTVTQRPRSLVRRRRTRRAFGTPQPFVWK